MNVLYCGDGYVERGVLLSALSLAGHLSAEEPLRIWLVTATVGGKAPIDEAFAAFLDELLQQEHSTASGVTLIDATAAFEAEPPTANMGTRFTPCCMLRLYIDQLPGMPERLLYLDNDVVCMADPRELWEYDLAGAEFAGVLDYYGRFFFRERLLHMDYVNSGVLLMDLGRMRQTGLLAACRAQCAEKQMFMPDQSALNHLAARKLLLPRRFNDQRRLHPDTVMRHFSNCFGFFPPRLISVKPWDVEGMHEKLHCHELDGLLQRYQREWERYEQLQAASDAAPTNPTTDDDPDEETA